MKKNKKKIYVGLAADILHEGHIKILNHAATLGEVTVGLLTDHAVASYKKIPHLNFKNRVLLLENFKQISKIIPQESLDYTKNLELIKPNYVVHGDDWKKGLQKNTRAKVIKTLKKWSGELIELKYTKNISSNSIYKIFEKGNTPDIRRSKLKRVLAAKGFVRILEAHDALSGLIVENSQYYKKGKYETFDGIWSSSLADSLTKGRPDDQSVDLSSRLLGLGQILDVTTKPIIFDADNGGRIEHLTNSVNCLERVGVSAMIMEDKIGYKINSLFKNQNQSNQDSIKNFCKKIEVVKKSSYSNDFMMIARIESLILGKPVSDALKRAESYSKAGADAILIHSKSKNPNEIFEFSKKYTKKSYAKPLVSVPSTYSSVYEKRLKANGFSIIIYANHQIRAAYKSMLKTANSILKNKRSFESEKYISSISEVLNVIKINE